MSNEMNMDEVIYELDRIDALYNRHQLLISSMNDLVKEKEVEDKRFAGEIVTALNAFRAEKDQEFSAPKPCIAQNCLTVPPEPPKKPNISNPAKSILVGAISGLSVWGSFLLFVLLSALGSNAGMTVGTLVLLPAIVFWLIAGAKNVTMFVDWQKNKKEWEKKQTEWEAKFNQSATQEENERFLNECVQYDTCFLELVDACSRKHDEEIERYRSGLETIKDEYLKKLDTMSDELSGITKELGAVTLIHGDLLHNAGRISSMLKTGRADSLKEAINLAIDEERKDMEEAARREEARQQEAILEQQVRDNRLHNEAMQRAAEEEARAMRAHHMAMENAAQAQAREAAKQTEIAQKQIGDAQRAAAVRCGRCINSSKCSFQVKRNAINCSSYRPR